MKPISRALTRTLNGPPSPASTLVSAMPAARGHSGRRAARARRLGADIERVDDAPPSAAPFICGPDQAGHPDGGEQLLVKILAAKISSVICSKGALRGDARHCSPGMSILPKAAMVSAKARLKVGHDRDRRPAPRGRRPPCRRPDGFHREVERPRAHAPRWRHRHPTPANRDRDREPDAPAPAGDHGPTGPLD